MIRAGYKLQGQLGTEEVAGYKRGQGAGLVVENLVNIMIMVCIENRQEWI